MALVLEEIQVAQPVDLRVMHRVLARDPGVGEAAARDKGHDNGELPFGGIKATLSAGGVIEPIQGRRNRAT